MCDIIRKKGGVIVMSISMFVNNLLEADFTAIGSLIGTVGFPAALSVGLLYCLFRVQKEHKEETNQLKEAITELKLVMSQILEHIRKTEDKGE